MLDDNFDDILKVMIENVLDSTSGNIDRGKLETFMLGLVDKMKDGKPIITLNHAEDGSGNSFADRVKTLGKASLSDATEEWREVPEEGDQTMHFFKVQVEMP